ncbi:SDR family NAD(P)-dependent oxidoreductase [Mycolicibacterium moriokaense]|nr:SDR family NAD(P)-dependent oxidoreductase [Mycolicibacterium moriokaense]
MTKQAQGRGRLDGKVAIITGANGYIGHATAQLFAAEGARVVLSDISPEVAEKAEKITGSGGEATSIVTDVTNEEQVEQMVDFAVEKYGRLDVLHNNATATLATDTNVVDTPTETWDLALKVNLYHTIWGCKYAVPKMIAGGGGSIINMSALAYAFGETEFMAYGVSKAAIAGLTRFVASQYGKQGIRCNAIAPGFAVGEERVAMIPQEIADVFLEHTLTTRLGSDKDMAHLALFLASDESGFMTGQVLRSDGGLGSHVSTMTQIRAIGQRMTALEQATNK